MNIQTDLDEMNPKRFIQLGGIPDRSFFDAIDVLKKKNMVIVYTVDGKEGNFIKAPPADEWKGLNNTQKHIIKLFKDDSQNDRKIFKMLLEPLEELAETPESKPKVVSIKTNAPETTTLNKKLEIEKQLEIEEELELEKMLATL